MLTYNHGKYLREALESVLMQDVNFEYEVVIGDDFSTDDSREIITEYEKKYPGRIKPIFHNVNVGIAKNFEITWFQCKGRFIALLEGDDYWTNSHKLQMQYDFLNENEDYVACYQKSLEINEITGHQKITNEDDKAETNLSEILSRGWFMRTASIMTRNNLFDSFPDFFFEHRSTDYILHILIAQKGNIKFINDITSVYRRHELGITQDFARNRVSFNESKIRLLKKVDNYLGFKYRSEIKNLIADFHQDSFICLLKDSAPSKHASHLLKHFVCAPRKILYRVLISMKQTLFTKTS